MLVAGVFMLVSLFFVFLADIPLGSQAPGQPLFTALKAGWKLRDDERVVRVAEESATMRELLREHDTSATGYHSVPTTPEMGYAAADGCATVQQSRNFSGKEGLLITVE